MAAVLGVVLVIHCWIDVGGISRGEPHTVLAGAAHLERQTCLGDKTCYGTALKYTITHTVRNKTCYGTALKYTITHTVRITYSKFLA